MKKRLLNNLLLIILLGCVAWGIPLHQNVTTGVLLTGWIIIAELVVLTLAYFVAAGVNFRGLIPRLLLQNRLMEYALTLVISTAFFVVIEICFDWLLIDIYDIPSEASWFFSQNTVGIVFRIISTMAAYAISLVGLAIILFQRLWEQSGNRVNDMEEQNARSEVKKARSRIDSEALFHTLESAADLAEQTPREASAMLMDLSRSLRTQLYESHHKSSPALQEPTSREFDLHSPVLDLLTERRYHILRHVIMVCWFIFITANDLLFDNSHRYLDVFLPLFSFIILIYFNLYVLVPKFMLRGKAKAYLAWAALSVVVVATPALMFYLQQVQLSFWSSLFFFIGSLFKLSLPIFGVSVLVLFRQWVLNERRIAELNTATLLSELEQLQNQVNPHFLFNMLNNIIVLVKTAPKQGADVIRKLNDMLKYQFHGSARQTIRLGDDIHFLNDYLNLEKLRRDRFEFHISAEPGMEHITLPPLLFIPFVENAVKHSNTNSTPSYVNLKFTRKADALLFTCVNSKPQPPLRKGQAGGLGLLNIRRRLDLLYGEGYDLNITENDISYTVRLSIELKPEKP